MAVTTRTIKIEVTCVEKSIWVLLTGFSDESKKINEIRKYLEDDTLNPVLKGKIQNILDGVNFTELSALIEIQNLFDGNTGLPK